MQIKINEELEISDFTVGEITGQKMGTAVCLTNEDNSLFLAPSDIFQLSLILERIAMESLGPTEVQRLVLEFNNSFVS